MPAINRWRIRHRVAPMGRSYGVSAALASAVRSQPPLWERAMPATRTRMCRRSIAAMARSCRAPGSTGVTGNPPSNTARSRQPPGSAAFPNRRRTMSFPIPPCYLWEKARMETTVMHSLRRGIAAILLSALAPAAGAVTATFDDLPLPPPLDGVSGLYYANDESDLYRGIFWDTRFRVVGDAYYIDPVEGPPFGIPHSGHYFVTNELGTVAGVSTDDGLTITTSLVLTEAWFGQNEYYGFGGGADQITIRAMAGDTILGSVTADLPDNLVGKPEPLQKVDTSAFLALHGITGYRIDRHATGEFNSSWVADDFVFTSVVPEPGTWGLMGVGGLVLIGVCCARARKQPASVLP